MLLYSRFQWMEKLIRQVQVSAVGLMVLALLLGGGAAILDRIFPPNLARYHDLARVVVDRHGMPLRYYLSRDESFRLPVLSTGVDSGYLEMLVAYEDKRFYEHPGVDVLALLRASGQILGSGRVVSGASTLTMQAARLLEPRPRTLANKLVEMARALQLERHYSKEEILSLYLTLAPFGGNVEGVEAGAQVLLGRPPRNLTPTEAALLVALPQSPTRLRPDRHPLAARAARDKVLTRVAEPLEIEAGHLTRLLAEDLPRGRSEQPFIAPLLAERMQRGHPDKKLIKTTLDGALQQGLEQLVRRSASDLGPAVSISVLVVENASREVRAYIGSADFRAEESQGQVDMVSAVRSPGSTLKPLIYGLAFERGLAHPASRVNDAPRPFGAYMPKNFQDRYYGEVDLTEALRKSLNVPAVLLLERLGPVNFVERLRRNKISMDFPDDSQPALPVALGGVGMQLEDLVRLYAAMADDGVVRPLVFGPEDLQGNKETQEDSPLLKPGVRAQIRQILLGVDRPVFAASGKAKNVAYKTGTSYGFRDAWALGFNDTYSVGVWIGRPDGTPNPGHYGYKTAAPLMFEVFDALPENPGGKPRAKLVTVSLEDPDLPPGLQYIDRPLAERGERSRPGPRILFPLSGAEIPLDLVERGIPLQAEGGSRPYRWIINGRPYQTEQVQGFSTAPRLMPDGLGFTEITLVDALGRKSTSQVRFVKEAASVLKRSAPTL
ncbi:penicillin-binding protein 1C [Kiloniella laminariae]|uniref:peptidoglycan glycosyltransferase n=1 Tax=Kiloniella laminariae TaxID=454162 RepID=A0ABT4LFU3_9PROT|nr:penicillin-binding protein 1C [Kiloniella laminariae]MCZ4279964.1 penicillin-binding protein 1C [Kiloniella laminariae]